MPNLSRLIDSAVDRLHEHFHRRECLGVGALVVRNAIAARWRHPSHITAGGDVVGGCLIGYETNSKRKESDMRRNDALPGNYLAKEDFDTPVVAKIVNVAIEEIQSDHGTENKPVVYIEDTKTGEVNSRGFILNGTNWDMIVETTGEEDSDDWTGHRIEIYHDPSIMFGRKKVGGIRVRQAPEQVGTGEEAFD